MSIPTRTIICTRCEHRNRPVARFCARCGDVLAGSPKVAAASGASGVRLVVGLVAIGVVLASYALFARVQPERPLRMNLWNPPGLQALQEKERIRQDPVSASPRDDDQAASGNVEADNSVNDNTVILEYRMEGPYREIIE